MTSVLRGLEVELEGPLIGADGAEAAPAWRGAVQGGGVAATEGAGVEWPRGPGPGWVARARDTWYEVSRCRWLWGAPHGVTPNPFSRWRWG